MVFYNVVGLSMKSIFFAYLLYEIPCDQSLFCKIGITSFPRMRFITLQEGNPRELVVWMHTMRRIEMPGLPFPTKKLALAYEFDLLSTLERRGQRLNCTYDYDNPRPVAREWIAGIEATEVWMHMLCLYEHYISCGRLASENFDEKSQMLTLRGHHVVEWRQMLAVYRRAYSKSASTVAQRLPMSPHTA